MMPSCRAALVLLLLAAPVAQAQHNPSGAGSMPMHHSMGGPMGPMVHNRSDTIPTESGQAAFRAIAEIVALLRADPATDWSKVDIDALRQHLIDMEAVTLRAEIRKTPIEGGVRIAVTGTGPIVASIQRMVPDHAREIDGTNGWTVRTTPLPDGSVLTVTAGNADATQQIRALGFIGIMVQGGHHPIHHLAIAKGETVHRH
ncbi:MAG: hypothetical protein WCI94_20050 [Rhodospirillales bacterium]